MKRSNVGGVLLILDGDVRKVGRGTVCAAKVAKALAKEAIPVGGGSIFSVATVFARQEYESWLIAGIESFAGKTLPDGRAAAPADVEVPDGDLEESPRNAKGWLGSVVQGGYKPTRDQAALTDLLDLGFVRDRGLRSFRRLESAVAELVAAIRSDSHVVTPLDTA